MRDHLRFVAGFLVAGLLALLLGRLLHSPLAHWVGVTLIIASVAVFGKLAYEVIAGCRINARKVRKLKPKPRPTLVWLGNDD